ncbi:hypothetical protein JZ751_018269 [Albula glossodonta]|uniref:Uncharacterized protein n=1 Tax=Albula glossodonta TaxID=121402 RepID=A0A8T2NWJ4_9TELE|nr:hypothetical protein JZ751_018269 [Albula glossodonta]
MNIHTTERRAEGGLGNKKKRKTHLMGEQRGLLFSQLVPCTSESLINQKGVGGGWVRGFHAAMEQESFTSLDQSREGMHVCLFHVLTAFMRSLQQDMECWRQLGFPHRQRQSNGLAVH